MRSVVGANRRASGVRRSANRRGPSALPELAAYASGRGYTHGLGCDRGAGRSAGCLLAWRRIPGLQL